MYQGAIPDILHKTKKEDLSKVVDIVREAAETCYDKLKQIPCIVCPHKPVGSIFMMVSIIMLFPLQFQTNIYISKTL